jgi:hypothetical protein
LPPWRQEFFRDEGDVHVFDQTRLRWYIPPPGDTVFEHGTWQTYSALSAVTITYRQIGK